MNKKLRQYGSLIVTALKSKTGRKIEAALIAYAVTELTRRGWLPS